MAGESVSYTAAEAFQDYIREFREDLFSQLFYGFKTSQLATPHEGVKGELVLTELQIGDNLVKRWSKTFAAVSGAVDFNPRVLATVLNKVDLSIVPQEYESSYLGMMRRKGQDPTDWPFQAYVLERLMAKIKQEMEYAIWQAEAAGSPSSNDYLRQTFDGYLTIIEDAIAATTITPVTTGAITSSNAVASFRLLWNELLDPYKESGVDFFCSYSLYDAYRINYKTLYGQHPNEVVINDTDYMGLQYELGGGQSMIIPVSGLSGSGRVVCTPRANLHYGVDAFEDFENFNVEQDTRELKFWMDFRMGAQIGILQDGILVVNDQA